MAEMRCKRRLSWFMRESKIIDNLASSILINKQSNTTKTKTIISQLIPRRQFFSWIESHIDLLRIKWRMIILFPIR
jgi:hypothetical protein